MAARVLDPAEIAAAFRADLRAELAKIGEPLKLVGFLSVEGGPSATYAEYTRKGCEDVGVAFELRHVKKLEAEEDIAAANADPAVHGILVYYPVFGTEHDAYLRDLVDPSKDVEGLHSFWARCLYANRRFIDPARTKKAILPCTPLAILKLLDAAGANVPGARKPFGGRSVVVFNRSEVVGRPLAAMLANDGAEVTSFDVDGPLLFASATSPSGHVIEETNVTRAEALKNADIVVTGVPSRQFPIVRAEEIKAGAVCLNFSTFKNFDDDVKEKARAFVPRVGPMTVTMALRNTLRLYRNSRG